VDTPAKVTGELIQAEAAHLRAVDLSASRTEEIAIDIANIVGSVSAARNLLDFNDEPARFDACLHPSAGKGAQRRRGSR
jgi:hypothetical protein